MKKYKYSIELHLKDECNAELATSEFSRALELPKLMFRQNLQSMSLRYFENEKDLAQKHCFLLNQELTSRNFNNVEFRIK
jgi:hypothetical protein